MHYVELDVNNLRRWMTGATGSNAAGCANGAGPLTCAMDITGFVVYFSDRRTNRDLGGDAAAEVNFTVANGFTYADDRETGEFGFEDNINPGSATSVANNALDGAFVDAQGQNRFAEDVNARDDRPGDVYVPTLETYGGVARTLPMGTGAGNQICLTGGACATAAANRTPVNDAYNLFTTPIDRNVARVNRAYFFRRGAETGERRPRESAGQRHAGPDGGVGESGLRPGQLQRVHQCRPEHRKRVRARLQRWGRLRYEPSRRPRVGRGDCRLGDVPLECVERHPHVSEPERRQHRHDGNAATRGRRRRPGIDWRSSVARASASPGRRPTPLRTTMTSAPTAARTTSSATSRTGVAPGSTTAARSSASTRPGRASAPTSAATSSIRRQRAATASTPSS